MSSLPTITAEIRELYRRYSLANTLRNSKVACALVMVLMPAGYVMDRVVFPEQAHNFLLLRLLSSFMAGGVLLALTRPGWSKPTLRLLYMGWYLIPAIIICTMIAQTKGLDSTYYAGLNLVILAASSIIQATLWESIVAISIILSLYIVACVLPIAPFDAKMAFNNGFFLFCTSAIVITGNYFYNNLRFREFILRYQLDKNKRELEISNLKLADQNTALNQANREIKEAEMQLVQSEKMSSLGRFSAGLMHDILNPLNYSRTGAYTLRKKSRDLPPELRATFEEILTDIEDGLKRVDNIVSDLRTFTHPGGQLAEDTDVGDVFNISLRFVSSEVREKNVAVELDLEPGQKAWISRNHLILVLVNLMENSLDALAEKNYTEGEKPAIQISSRSENGRTLIFIRDNGPGINPAIMPKIFDPFYTTKDVGKGTGLGLSICFGIMNGYGGSIAANSEPGEFCEFILDLPATSEAAVKTTPQNAEPLRL